MTEKTTEINHTSSSNEFKTKSSLPPKAVIDLESQKLENIMNILADLQKQNEQRKKENEELQKKVKELETVQEESNKQQAIIRALEEKVAILTDEKNQPEKNTSQLELFFSTELEEINRLKVEFGKAKVKLEETVETIKSDITKNKKDFEEKVNNPSKFKTKQDFEKALEAIKNKCIQIDSQIARLETSHQEEIQRLRDQYHALDNYSSEETLNKLRKSEGYSQLSGEEQKSIDDQIAAIKTTTKDQADKILQSIKEMSDKMSCAQNELRDQFSELKANEALLTNTQALLTVPSSDGKTGRLHSKLSARIHEKLKSNPASQEAAKIGSVARIAGWAANKVPGGSSLVPVIDFINGLASGFYEEKQKANNEAHDYNMNKLPEYISEMLAMAVIQNMGGEKFVKNLEPAAKKSFFGKIKDGIKGRLFGETNDEFDSLAEEIASYVDGILRNPEFVKQLKDYYSTKDGYSDAGKVLLMAKILKRVQTELAKKSTSYQEAQQEVESLTTSGGLLSQFEPYVYKDDEGKEHNFNLSQVLNPAARFNDPARTARVDKVRKEIAFSLFSRLALSVAVVSAAATVALVVLPLAAAFAPVAIAPILAAAVAAITIPGIILLAAGSLSTSILAYSAYKDETKHYAKKLHKAQQTPDSKLAKDSKGHTIALNSSTSEIVNEIGTNLPKNKTSEAVKSEAVKSEAVKSEAVKSEAVKSEAVKSEAVKPEAVKPEAVKPEAVKPEGKTLEGEALEGEALEETTQERNSGPSP